MFKYQVNISPERKEIPKFIRIVKKSQFIIEADDITQAIIIASKSKKLRKAFEGEDGEHPARLMKLDPKKREENKISDFNLKKDIYVTDFCVICGEDKKCECNEELTDNEWEKLVKNCIPLYIEIKKME